MAADSRYSTTIRNAILAAIAAVSDGAILKIYDGTRPATADTAITTQNLLATFTLGTPAFAAPASGSMSANAIPNVTIAATSTASWFRLFESDGVTVICDGNIDTANANLVMNSTALQVNATAQIASLTLTAAASGS